MYTGKSIGYEAITKDKILYVFASIATETVLILDKFGYKFEPISKKDAQKITFCGIPVINQLITSNAPSVSLDPRTLEAKIGVVEPPTREEPTIRGVDPKIRTTKVVDTHPEKTEDKGGFKTVRGSSMPHHIERVVPNGTTREIP